MSNAFARGAAWAASVCVLVGACGGATTANELEARDRSEHADAAPEDGGPAQELADAGTTLDRADASAAVDAARPHDAETDRADAGAGTWAGCAEREYLLCEDFESGSVDPARWRVVERDGTVAVDAERAAHGRFAMRAGIDGTTASSAWIVHEDGLTEGEPHFFVRMFVYHEGPPPAHNWNYATFGGLLGTERTQYRLGGTTEPFGDPDGARVARLMYMPAHVAQRSSAPIETDVWQCWEWEVDGDSDATRVWRDGVELEDLRGTDGFRRGPWAAPAFDRLEIGLSHPDHSEGDRTLRAFVDDVVLDRARIGCGTR